MLIIDHIELDTGGCREGGRIDDFELAVGKSNNLLLAKDLKGPTNVNVRQTERLSDVALAQRQVNVLTRLDRQPVAKPDVDF